MYVGEMYVDENVSRWKCRWNVCSFMYVDEMCRWIACRFMYVDERGWWNVCRFMYVDQKVLWHAYLWGFCIITYRVDIGASKEGARRTHVWQDSCGICIYIATGLIVIWICLFFPLKHRIPIQVFGTHVPRCLMYVCVCTCLMYVCAVVCFMLCTFVRVRACVRACVPIHPVHEPVALRALSVPAGTLHPR